MRNEQNERSSIVGEELKVRKRREGSLLRGKESCQSTGKKGEKAHFLKGISGKSGEEERGLTS
jgi:hypothetical protein